ncbi:MAG: GldG family protein [Clostridia bacterium]|nr:GldG family protein [Clostridia bacterium]
MTEEKDFINNQSETNENEAEKTVTEEAAVEKTETAEAEEVSAEEAVFDEEGQTVEEVAENEAAAGQSGYAALGGHVSSAKVPRINKNRVKFGSLSLLFTILFIAIVIAINVVVTLAAQRFNLKVDLTSEKVFTLDQETKDFLAELKSPVEVIILGDETTYRSATSTSGAIAPTRYVVETVDNYVRESEYVTVHFVDPRYNPNFFKSRNITLDDGTDTADNIFLVVYSPETQRYRFIKDTIFENLMYVGLERRLTAGMLYATVEDIQTVAIIKGHGEGSLPYFQETLKDNGFDVKYITIQDFDEIPDFVSVLVINNPTRNYSDDDINKIDAWLSNNEDLGHHLMIFTDLNMPKNPKLEDYLVEWGLALGTENIFDYSNSYAFTNASYPLLKVKYADDAKTLAEDLSREGYYQFVQLGAARAVYRLFDSKDTRKTYGVIDTFSTAFSRFTASTTLAPTDWKNFTYDEENDTVGPFYLSAISRQTRYEGMTEFSSSVYLCGSTSFVDDYFVSNIDGNNQQTAEFMIKLCKFLVASKKSYDTDILPAQLIFDTLAFETTTQVVVTVLGIVLVLPLIFSVIGIIVWRKRKFL